MRRYPLTWSAIVVLAACGVFGWGSSLRARAGDLLHWHGNGASWTVRDFGPTNEETMRIVRRRVPSGLPIYVVRGEPLSETAVHLRRGGGFLGQVPDVDDPIDPATISVAARPRAFGSPYLVVTTVYGPTRRFDDPPPFLELRPSREVRVVVYAPGLDPAVSRQKLRAWLRARLVPYGG